MAGKKRKSREELDKQRRTERHLEVRHGVPAPAKNGNVHADLHADSDLEMDRDHPPDDLKAR